MAFESFIADQLLGVERFLANPEQVALEIERTSDLAMLAAKVIAAGQDDADSHDLYLGFDHPFEDPIAWCQAIADGVAADLEATAAVWAEQQLEFEFPDGLDDAQDLRDQHVQGIERSELGIELRLLEYLETVARALDPWVRRLVLMWDPGDSFDRATQAAWTEFATRLFAASGSGSIKWIVFCEPGQARIAGLVAPRRRALTWAEAVGLFGETDTLARFVRDPLARLLTHRGDARAVEWFGHQFVRSRQLGSRQTLSLFVTGEAFRGPLWFYRVAALALAKQLRELERHSFGTDERIAPFVEGLEQPSMPLGPERWFVEQVEAMLDALVRVEVVIILAPDPGDEADHAHPCNGTEAIAASLRTLASMCVRTNLSLVFVDSRVPERGVAVATDAVGSQRFDLDSTRVAAELRDHVDDPALSELARISYRTALAGMASAEDQPEQALDHASAAVAAAASLGEPSQIAITQYALGNTLYHATGFALAEQAYAEAIDVAVSHNLAMLSAHALLGLGNCRFMQADFDGARGCYATAGTYFEKFGLGLGQVQALTWLGEAAIRKRDWATAREEFERGLAICDGVDPNYGQLVDNSRAELLLRLARLLDTVGLPAEAAQQRHAAHALGATVEPEHVPS